MGQLVTVQQILIHAAREGRSKAALSTTVSETDVQNVVKDYLRRGAIPAGVADGVAVTCVPRHRRQPIRKRKSLSQYKLTTPIYAGYPSLFLDISAT
jgi:hypothetical protein